jgi:gluconolactonase
MDECFEIQADVFRHILGPQPALIEVAGGMAFAEGTCYVPRGDFFIWSDIPNDRLMRWSERDGVGIFRQGTGNSNGNTVDREGRILTCETRGRRVSMTGLDGSVRTLVDSYNGQPLTSPNDIVVKSDGSVWFTDPDYGHLEKHIGHGRPPVQERNRVYRFEPTTGALEAVAEDFDKPNGLAFSPNESVLYISDSGRTHGDDRPHHVRAFDVVDGRRLTNSRVLALVEPWVPDGLRLDVDGNLYVTAGDGVQVFDPAGELLGKILTPEIAANCAFGGPEGDLLLIAATSSVWRIRLRTRGASRPTG